MSVTPLTLHERAGFAWPLGRAFVSPAFDLLFIAGGLSLVFGVLAYGAGLRVTGEANLAIVLLFANFAHFAASTVRLYTKRGAVAELPRALTLWLPVAMLALFTAVLLWAGWLVRYVFAVFVIWSPYHYSAQAFGLAVMYAIRSGCGLSDLQRRALWLACLVPFFWSLLRPDAGVAWMLQGLGLHSAPPFESLRWGLSGLLSVAALLTPVVVIARLRMRDGLALPVISVLTIMTNAIWWTLFEYVHAMWWAAIFHGVQYLAIVTVFHVRERVARPANPYGPVYHATVFYGACVVLAYALFVLWPDGYTWMGFDGLLTAQLTVAVINLHHFIVDAYIWRLRKDPNLAVVRA
jgi:hypothetical protein